MSWIAGALGAGGSLLGSYLGYKAQEETNETNIELAEENRGWMERMSNTAYQRARTDMEKAGINPILSATRGGASTPSAQAAHVESAAPILANAGTAAVNASLTAQTQQQQIRTQRSQEQVNTAEKARLEAERLRLEQEKAKLELENKRKSAELPAQTIKAKNEAFDEATRHQRPGWMKVIGRSIRDYWDTMSPLKFPKF